MKTFAIICLVITCSIAFAERSTNDVSVYSGIGIVVSTNDGLQVARVAIGSPADAGDIHFFDRIIKIDGRNTAGMSLSEASSLLRGPEGSITTLTILGITNGATRELEITRARFDNPKDIRWKNEVLTSLQIPGSTNVAYLINEEPDAQQLGSGYGSPAAGSPSPDR